MKVILLQNIPNLGNKGEVKEVADGYGRNFLLPRKLAIIATKNELERLTKQKSPQRRLAEEAGKGALPEELQKKISTLILTIKEKADPGGRLYASIKPQRIVEELEKHKISIKEKNIDIAKPIKKVGRYSVLINLSKDIKAKLNIVVSAL